MINAILQGIFTIVINLVSSLLSFIDDFVIQYLPGLSSAFDAISSLFTYIISAIGWVLSVFGLSSNCISLIILYFTFKLTVPLLVSFFKLAVRWYNKLKI